MKLENDITAIKEFTFRELIIVKEYMSTRSPLYIATLLKRPEHEITDLLGDLGALKKRIEEKAPGKKKTPAPPKEKVKKEKAVKVRVPAPPKVPRVKALIAKHQKRRGSSAISKKITEERKVDPDKKEKFYKPAGNSDMRKGPLFKTKEVNYGALVKVQIDKRTVIYIKSGEDPIAARENYLIKYSKP